MYNLSCLAGCRSRVLFHRRAHSMHTTCGIMERLEVKFEETTSWTGKRYVCVCVYVYIYEYIFTLYLENYIQVGSKTLREERCISIEVVWDNWQQCKGKTERKKSRCKRKKNNSPEFSCLYKIAIHVESS